MCSLNRTNLPMLSDAFRRFSFGLVWSADARSVNLTMFIKHRLCNRLGRHLAWSNWFEHLTSSTRTQMPFGKRARGTNRVPKLQ